MAGKGYHHGVAIGDVNNDGFQDVYICNFGGPDEFFVSDGKGRFIDATESAGFLKGKTPVLTSPDNWSSTAAFFDADGDGIAGWEGLLDRLVQPVVLVLARRTHRRVGRAHGDDRLCHWGMAWLHGISISRWDPRLR